VFGNSDGFGNSMEHNIVHGRRLLCLHTLYAGPKKTYNDNPFGRHGNYIFNFNAKVMSYLSLAAACSAASVTDILHQAGESHCPAKSCGRYQLSAAMAFLSWFLSSASWLFNFWLLPSL
ncbi:hypothetical protein L195_g009154, partial [Trifolium pratense]